MAPIALTIAGSDSGGGAGIQADLKTFSALGVYGASVITAITAQNTRDVAAVHPVPIDVVEAQIEAVLSDMDVKAIKIGMLGTPDLIRAVAARLKSFDGPIVLDPVMVAKSGATLLADEALEALRTHLLPLATVLTPNIPEAAKLLDQAEELTASGLQRQGQALFDMGPGAVLMKGGHGLGEVCTDWLISAKGATALKADRIQTKNTHGTGCTLSSAIAAGLARGKSLETAVHAAHGWLHQAIRHADELNVGNGHGPVHHFHGVWE
ncbi:MAG: bifunctional hydroxymethylpyrimidine kinase/phosphomethylpyrimidine kinase [Thalassovita sp.]